MLKLTVRFEKRDDGGLRAWCDDLPGFVLSHSDAQAVIRDVEPALEAMLAAKYECKVRVYPLTQPEKFDLTPELSIPAFMIPKREYASQIC
ncbi:hypothetical protein [Qipengyuania mesophila]|uniref:hypothetical protein n=1 Tax=Qipengyuania mesophila TaxID=2867246 RepID=UPI003513FBF7